jgi:Chaperone of endosialidase
MPIYYPGPDADKRTAIQDAIQLAYTNGGGIVQLENNVDYNITSGDINILPGVTLQGGFDPGGFRSGNNYSGVAYRVTLDSARTIRMSSNSGLKGVAVLRSGLSSPTSLASAFATVNAFAGTALTLDASGSGLSDIQISDLLILGFTHAIRALRVSRLKIHNVKGDCTNGLHFDRSFDVSNISSVNWHPFMTTSNTFSDQSYTVKSIANSGGRIRLTVERPSDTSSAPSLASGLPVIVYGVYGTVANADGKYNATVVSQNATTAVVDLQGSSYVGSYTITAGSRLDGSPNYRSGSGFYLRDQDANNFVDCFSFGHTVGWHLDGSMTACNFVNCGCDGGGFGPGTTGIKILGLSAFNKWFGGFISQKLVSLSVNVPSGAAEDYNHFSGLLLPRGGNAGRSVELVDGNVVLSQCDIRGKVYIGGDQASCTLIGCDTRAGEFVGGTPTALQGLQILGCTPAGASSNRLLGGASITGPLDVAGEIGIEGGVEHSDHYWSNALRFEANSGTYPFYVYGAQKKDNSDAYLRFVIGNSTPYEFHLNGYAVAPAGWLTPSDERLKGNRAEISNPLTKVAGLSGVTFNRLDMNGQRSAGLLAQEVAKVLPEAVVSIDLPTADQQSTHGILTVNHAAVVALLVESVKALHAKVEELETQVHTRIQQQL